MQNFLDELVLRGFSMLFRVGVFVFAEAHGSPADGGQYFGV
jgi:hypothetical protein